MSVDFDVRGQRGMNLFLTNTQFIISLGVMVDWNCVDYCDALISCLNSFWRHTFTAEDPLVNKWCKAKISNKETNSSTLGWPGGERILGKILFWMNYFFKSSIYTYSQNIIVYVGTVMAKNMAPLVIMVKEGCEN